MLSEPKFITREPEPYAAIHLTVQQPEIPQKAPPLVPEILGWLGKHARQTGPVFFNYTRMDGGKMEMEVGAPVAAGAKGDDRVKIGTLPGGRYVTATWTGPYDRLHGAHMQLHDWLARQNLHPVEASGRTTLLEVYITDPDEVADPRQWVTDLVFRLGD